MVKKDQKQMDNKRNKFLETLQEQIKEPKNL
jgi:hypothetical protein